LWQAKSSWYDARREELLQQLEKKEDELLDEMMEDAEEDEFIFGMYQ